MRGLFAAMYAVLSYVIAYTFSYSMVLLLLYSLQETSGTTVQAVFGAKDVWIQHVEYYLRITILPAVGGVLLFLIVRPHPISFREFRSLNTAVGLIIGAVCAYCTLYGLPTLSA